MASKRWTPLKAISSIVPGKRSIQKIPIGPRYHALMIEAQAAGKIFTQIVEEIAVVVDGKVQREYTAAQLNDINERNGENYAYEDNGAGNASHMTIHFMEPWRKDIALADGMAWRSESLQTFQLEITIAANAPATSQITVYAAADDSILRDKAGKAIPTPLGQISKVDRKRLNLNSTKVTDFELESGDWIQVISFYDPHITRVKMKVNKFEVLDITKQVADKILRDHGLIPSEDRFDIVFDYDDPPSSAFPIARADVVEFEIAVKPEDEDDETTAIPRTIDVLVEKVGLPN